MVLRVDLLSVEGRGLDTRHSLLVLESTGLGVSSLRSLLVVHVVADLWSEGLLVVVVLSVHALALLGGGVVEINVVMGKPGIVRVLRLAVVVGVRVSAGVT